MSFLIAPTYFNSYTHIKFIVHHSNLSQRGKGKFTEEIIREGKEKELIVIGMLLVNQERSYGKLKSFELEWHDVAEL